MAIDETNVTSNANYAPTPNLFDQNEEGFDEDVNYKISAITFDFSIGSVGANKFIDSLLKLSNQKILNSVVVRYYTGEMWKQAFNWLLVQFSFYFTLTVLLTLHVFYQDDDDWNDVNLNTIFLFVILGLSILSILNEVGEFLALKLNYFNDFWNI